MSNPEKRDERSMSDILASIRKIMAQEPGGAAPLGPMPSLNGVSGAKFDLSREPELKLPPERKPTEGVTPAAEAISLDELLAETPRVVPPAAPAQPLAPKPPVQAGPAPALGPAVKPADAPEWLFPKPHTSEAAKEKPAAPVLPLPTQAKVLDASSPASPAVKIGPPEQPTPPKEPASAAPPIGPPAPNLGDLGSVVPSKRDDGAATPVIAVGPSPSANAERPVLGPPLAGPLLGEPTRTPSLTDPLQEVPGADALRRLIAGVIPPSAHPSVAPAGAHPSIPPAGAHPSIAPAGKPAEPAAARADGAPKADAGPKPAPEIETETKATPAAPAPAAKKPELAVPTPAPTPAPTPKPIAAAAAPVSAPSPAPKPATPAPAARAEPHVGIPTPKPVAAPAVGSPAGKTMDETVVELLRPLLREWLNTNMPRLIEPALKAELEALRDAAAKEKKD